MPKVMKPPTDWDENDTETGGDWYDGPPPPPALYAGTVKKIYVHTVKDGEKKGEIRFHVICEIKGGKYNGAGVSKWLQLSTQGRPWLHQFLHSLTDGSEAQKDGIRKAFKTVGYMVGDPDDKGRLPLERIGKKFNPIGKEVSFVTKMRDSSTSSDGQARAEIARFVSRFAGEDDDDSAAEDVLGTDSGEGDLESAMDDLDASADVSDDDSDSEPALEDSSDDGDDPWSV